MMNKDDLKKKYRFKFMPGDKVSAIFETKKVIGVVDTCAISFNPVPKYWVIFEVGLRKEVNYGIQGWYPESLLKKEK
jgi:hypothetical protein